MSLKLKLLNLWRYNRALLGVQDPSDGEFAVPVSEAAPLPVRVVGGSVGGGAPAGTVSLSRTTLALSDQAQALPGIPAEATGARIAVEGGAARIATAAPDPTATDGERWEGGSVWQVTGPDLRALRVVAASGNPNFHITYTKGA